MKKTLLLIFSILCVNSFSYVERNNQVGNRGLELIRESNINQNMGLSKESGSTQIIDAYRGNGKLSKTKGFMIGTTSNFIDYPNITAGVTVAYDKYKYKPDNNDYWGRDYDVNRIKAISYQLADGDNETMEKMGIIGALNLYLDFINLFIYILRIFGRKK